jgi:hypothetical protein
MQTCASTWTATLIAAAVLAGPAASAQTLGAPESYRAVAILNNDLGSAAGVVLLDITRWSTAEERREFVTTLREKGSDALLDELREARSTGTIRTPDSLAYDLRFAHQMPAEDGGRRIILATDRPIGFWEAATRPRTFEYPFTVIQMEIGPDGEGKGTLSYAAKIIAAGDAIVLENFGTSPVMLTEIERVDRDE